MPQSNALQTGRIWAAVPVFNNAGTVKAVVASCRSIVRNVIVVDDGSIDADVAALVSGMDVVVLRHEKNLGKGRAIQTAARYVEDHGGAYLVTIDADGQHDPRDIAKFAPLLEGDDTSLVIGSRDFGVANVPASSRFGRKFANFWLKVETGRSVDDCQSGFRAYPVKFLNRLACKGSRYDFEAEVLAKASWAGLELKTVPISVYYPKPEERVSSFKPFLDNLRLSHTHVLLVCRRLLPLPYKRLVKQER